MEEQPSSCKHLFWPIIFIKKTMKSKLLLLPLALLFRKWSATSSNNLSMGLFSGSMWPLSIASSVVRRKGLGSTFVRVPCRAYVRLLFEIPTSFYATPITQMNLLGGLASSWYVVSLRHISTVFDQCSLSFDQVTSLS